MLHLAAGEYDLAVTSPGFERLTKRVHLKPGSEIVKIDAVLRHSHRFEVVQVGSPGVIQVSESDVLRLFVQNVIQLPSGRGDLLKRLKLPIILEPARSSR